MTRFGITPDVVVGPGEVEAVGETPGEDGLLPPLLPVDIVDTESVCDTCLLVRWVVGRSVG